MFPSLQLLQRTILTIVFSALFVLPSYADNGLAALGDAYEILIILGIWFFTSTLTLGLAFFDFLKTKSSSSALMTYVGMVSLILFFGLLIYLFIANYKMTLISGSNYSNETYSIRGKFWFFVFLEIVLIFSAFYFHSYVQKFSKKEKDTN